MAFTKQHILQEIMRIAEANDGAPPGIKRFEQETGIKVSDWRGRYWVNWSDATKEAGFTPNQYKPGYDKNFIIEKYIELIRELGRVPVYAELRMKSRKMDIVSQDKDMRM